jgi:hypothetical protein
MRVHICCLFLLFILSAFNPSSAFAKPPCPVNTDLINWTECVGEKYDREGKFYRGEFVKGVEHGIGEYRMTSFRWQRSEFSEGKFHGLGINIDVKQNSTALGEWKNGNLETGMITAPGGIIYFGDWKNQKFNGEGFYLSDAGGVSFGKWIDGNLTFNVFDKQSGKLCSDNSINDCYTKIGNENEFLMGYFRNRKLQGFGYVKTQDLQLFGWFQDNRVIGNAAIVFPDGMRYYGQVKDVLPHGWGVTYREKPYLVTYIGPTDETGLTGNGVMFADDVKRSQLEHLSSYYGKLRSGSADGAGLKIGSTGSWYYGRWMNDSPENEGLSVAEDRKYAGEWFNGEKEGLGVLVIEGKGIYNGEFKHGEPDGHGFMYYNDKSIKPIGGIWKSGQFVKDINFSKEEKKRLYRYAGSVQTLDSFSSFNQGKNRLSASESNQSPSSIVQTTEFVPTFTKPSRDTSNDIGVIIANYDYKNSTKDIPDVTPANSDGQLVQRYFQEGLGIKAENIIHLKNSTGTQLVALFGSDSNPQGKLFNWVKDKNTRVFIYYSGHGAPNFREEGGSLVPVDAELSTLQLSSYPLTRLYKNLGHLPSETVTVILEACFSGLSQGGNLLKNSSPIVIKPSKSLIPENVKVVAAGSSSQIASWEKDASYSLFTKYYINGMAGAADEAPHGNADGEVIQSEIKSYLESTVTYLARRYYGREQIPDFR